MDSWAWNWSGVWEEQLADLVAPRRLSRSAKCEWLKTEGMKLKEFVQRTEGPKQLPAWNIDQEKEFLGFIQDVLSNVHSGPVWVD